MVKSLQNTKTDFSHYMKRDIMFMMKQYFAHELAFYFNLKKLVKYGYVLNGTNRRHVFFLIGKIKQRKHLIVLE